MQNNFKFIITPENEGERVDAFLTRQLEAVSRTKIKNAIDLGFAKLNGKRMILSSYKLKNQDRIELDFPEAKESNHLVPKPMELDVRFEDEHLLIVNKPAGLTVHPGAGNQDDTLVNGLVHRQHDLSTEAGSDRPGIVHRLDKHTSGLMVIAKNDHVHQLLSEMIAEREIKRSYKALVWGEMPLLNGKIVTNIARSRQDKTKMINVQEKGKIAISYYRTLKKFADGSVSLLEFTLETGRTHQIRLHCLFEGHSIIGDPQYGAKGRKIKNLTQEQFDRLSSFKRQFLHSYKLEFIHPISEEFISIESELPKDLQQLLEIL